MSPATPTTEADAPFYSLTEARARLAELNRREAALRKTIRDALVELQRLTGCTNEDRRNGMDSVKDGIRTVTADYREGLEWDIEEQEA